MLPGDNLTRDGCLAFLSSNVPGLHVGGKTALAWRGVRQNLTFNERIGLWGEAPTRVPPWLTQRFSCSYQTTKIFDEALPVEFGVASLPGGRPDVLVSVSERALLELLSDVGKFQTLEETGNLAESARNLREPVMDELLAHVKRIKVARLARRLSEELELPWAALARTHSDRLGGADRWVAVSKTGVRLELKRK